MQLQVTYQQGQTKEDETSRCAGSHIVLVACPHLSCHDYVDLCSDSCHPVMIPQGLLLLSAVGMQDNSRGQFPMAENYGDERIFPS